MFHQVKKFPEFYRTSLFIAVVYIKQPAVAHILGKDESNPQVLTLFLQDPLTYACVFYIRVSSFQVSPPNFCMHFLTAHVLYIMLANSAKPQELQMEYILKSVSVTECNFCPF